MKKTISIVLVVLAALLCGCANNHPEQPVADATTQASPTTRAAYVYDLGSKKKGDMGLCVICSVDKGEAHEEAAAESIDYEGKTYLFCNEQEKATFISEPSKYAAK